MGNERGVEVTEKAHPIVTIQPMYLAKPSAAAFLSLSESAFEGLVTAGEVAKPRRLTAGRVGWRVVDLIAYGESRPASDLPPPPGTRFGRAGKPEPSPSM